MTWGRDTDEHEAADQLKQFVDAGGTLVDTAASYGEGAAEELLGSLLGALVPRDDVVLCTKAGMSRRAGVRAARHLAARAAGRPRRVAGAARHRPRRPVAGAHLERRGAAGGDAVGARARGQQRPGPLRRGLQLLRLADGAAAATLLAAGRAAPLVANEVEYSLVQRGRRARGLPPRPALGLGLLAWSPLGRGVLTGKYRTATPADSRGASPHFRVRRAVPGRRGRAGRGRGGHRRRRSRLLARRGGAGLGA